MLLRLSLVLNGYIEIFAILVGVRVINNSYPRSQVRILVREMVKAYVLIKTVNGVENEVLRQILELSVTEEAHLTFGLYDIIAEVKGRDMETLVEIITMKIRPIEGITDTQSLMAIDAEIDMSSTSLAS